MNKNLGLWQELVQFLQQNVTFAAAVMAVNMAILRSFFTKADEDKGICHKITDALICGTLTVSAIPLLKYVGLDEEFSIFFGSMIGFIGAEKIRELTFKVIAILLNKFSKNGGGNG